MTLHQQIKDGIKEAMKAKDANKLSVLRSVLSGCTNYLVANNRKPDEVLSDDEVLAVIKKGVKQRQDSIKQFTEGGREDLAQAEEEEMKILTSFLPEPMTMEEITKIAQQEQVKTGLTDKSQAGRLVGAVIKATAGRADGSQVKEAVDNLFN